MSFQQIVTSAVVRSLLSLPEPILVPLAGGAPQEVDGKRLNVRAHFLSHSAQRNPSLASLTPGQARKTTARAFNALSGVRAKDVTWEDKNIPTPEGDYELPIRVYHPTKDETMKPIVVYFHSGGAVVGDLQTGHSFCTYLSSHADCVVVSVDYRLAPEHKFPVPLNDAITAYAWAWNNTAELGGMPENVSVAGASMGANFAAAICQELKGKGKSQPVCQLLIYPFVDALSESRSTLSFANAFPLSMETMNWFLYQYLEPEQDRADPRVSPLRSTDVTGLAPAIVITAGFDPLCDQGWEYADKLASAEVPVTYRTYTSLPHAFTSMAGVIPAARTAIVEIAEDMEKRMRVNEDFKLGELEA